jgi:AraC-like DNA-binding protein
VLALILANFSEIPLYPKAFADEKAPIIRVQQVIHARYADDLRLDELAGVACLSKSYFIRAFRHHVGISPYAYLLQVRLNQAKTLLQNGVSATEVAHQTGFFDQSHFTRYFKRFLGITPAQYQGAIG